ncbi:MAG: hypothetical protein A2286_01975 [Gammaproteobacteria bacterium RIFOXYA12_FULL_61_12]|nr:MAG: hypothetical protein A2286_01975 [Gammaproteobacteria bacterium RIFOXYA12_FULL_61_12]
MVMVNTSVGLPDANFAATTTASIGAPEFKSSNTGYTVSGKEQKVPTPPGVAVSMTYTYDPRYPPVGSNLIDWAAPFFTARAPGIAAALKAYALSNGVSSGVYTYRQSVYVSGRTTPMTLFWQVVSMADGRHFSQDPQLLPDVPAYLQFTYTPKRIAEGLDTSWTYPNAGKLAYRLVKQDLSPLTGETLVDTNGAFDAPVYAGTGPIPVGCSQDATSGDVSCSQDFGVRCLIDKRSSANCPTTFPDMTTLMEDLVAVGGTLDYARALSPVYDEVDDPERPGEKLQIPRVAVSIDSRSVSRGRMFFFISRGGGREYIETGTVGYALRNQTDRYRVTADGQFEMAGQAVTTAISPTRAFVKTAAITGSCASYQPDQIIDPFNTVQIYNWRNDTVNRLSAANYVSVATLICQ